MGRMRKQHVFLSGLCFFILLLARNIIIDSLTIKKISASINESRSTTVILQHEGQDNNSSSPSLVRIIETNQTLLSIIAPILSYPNLNSTSSSSSHPLCTRNEIRVGFWKPLILDGPPYNPRTRHLQCYPESEYKTSAGQWKYTYEWQPVASSTTDCVLSNWNRDNFCNIMKRATILIIGDSLSFEHYRSLGHLLGIHISQFSQHKSKEEQGNIVNYACQKQTRIVYRRDDLLSNVSQAILKGGTFPQVIVMNRGAHYQNDTMLMKGMEKVVEELKIWKLKCQTFNITCHLLWRTSVPGHPNCEKRDFRGPVNDLHTMEAMISDRSNYNNRTIKYHWYDYQRQNQMVVDMLTNNPSISQQGQETSSHPFFLEIIDAYYLNVRRPDEHRVHQGDCLHNCYPGKQDVYSQLLLHFLKSQRKQSDIDSMIAWQAKYSTS